MTIGSMIDTAVTDWKYIPFAQESGKLLDKTVKMLSTSLDSLLFYNLISSQWGASEGLKKPFKALNEIYKWNEIGLLIDKLGTGHLKKAADYQKTKDEASKPSFFRDLSWTDRALVFGHSFNALESLQTLGFIRLSTISNTLEFIPGWKLVTENVAFTTVKDLSFLSATTISLFTDIPRWYNFQEVSTENPKLKKAMNEKLLDLRLTVIGNIAKAALLSISLVLNCTSYRAAYLIVSSIDLKDLKQPIALIGAVAGIWSSARKERSAEAAAKKITP